MSNKILLKSVSGGVGKTFLAANLANTLFKQKQKIVLVEISFSPVLPSYFGAKQPVMHSPAWKFQRYKLHDDFSLFCLRIDHTRPLSTIDMYLKNALSGINDLQFTAIIDAQCGLEGLLDRQQMDFVAEVVACEPSSLLTAAESQADCFILNKKDLRSAIYKDTMSTARTLFGEKLLCEVHFDISVQEAFANKQLLSVYAPGSPAHRDIDRLAMQLSELVSRPGNVSEQSA